MKLSIFILSCIMLVQTCNLQKNYTLPTVKKETIKKQETVIDFDKEIKPIFVKNCSPCHFPDGKMYARLPFDKDTTIINHSAGILKRIKNVERSEIPQGGEEENSLLKNFIIQNKNGLPESKP